jgi:hypothetical protein
MNNKIIFLDVDGVLNSNDTEDVFKGFIGLDNSGIKLLREIIGATKAEIVLVSSWKHRWYKDDKDRQDNLANYLDQRLAAEGLKIIDKTEGTSDRGTGIVKWLSEHPTESWIVFDDEIFPDYEECGIIPHLVKTSFYDGGLKDKHVEMAIKMLNSAE